MIGRQRPNRDCPLRPATPTVLTSLTAVALMLLVTGCDPPEPDDEPVPATTTTTPRVVETLIRGPDDSAETALDRALLTVDDIRRLGLPVRRRPTVDSFLVPNRCGESFPTGHQVTQYGVPVRTRESHGSANHPVSWRQDVGEMPEAAAAKLIADIAARRCRTFVSLFGLPRRDLGNIDIGKIAGVKHSVVFCWTSEIRGAANPPTVCMLLLHHADLMTGFTLITDFEHGREQMRSIALLVVKRLAAY